MDPVKILKRAWHILWSYRALWVFGLIIALTAAGSSGGGANNGTRISPDQSYSDEYSRSYKFDQLPEAIQDFNHEMERLFEQGSRNIDFARGELTAFLWIIAIFVMLMLAIGIVTAIGRYVSETAVIRMVDEYESTDTQMSVREGFRIGWSRTSWRLFLINLIVNLPVIILLAVAVIAGFSIYSMVESGNETFAAIGIIGVIGLVFLLIFVVVILSIFLRLLRHFIWRICALEDVGVGESFRRGFALVRENWKSVGLMWLVMIGLGIVWALVSFVIVLITLPLILVTLLIAIVVATIPALLLVGLFNLFVSNVLAWVLGAIFVAPLFFVIAFSPWVLVSAWQIIFSSTVWTLTYREIKAIPVEITAEEPAES